ncbi:MULTISPECIES: ABC transporter ATP-binding protein [unclassified Plantibacter]|uniref:ABC transporter ATP-binding protein n=1 Tax=unclassified Plantibacter TaxID=2624265 RepID=UPI003D34D17D
MIATLDAFELSKSYRGKTALDAFSLSIEPGQIHGLLGPNGSGKTTCLHILTGLLAPDTGAVTIAGVAIESKKSRGLLGFAPDDLPLPGSLTGREYLEFHDAMRKRNDTKHAAVLAQALGIDADLEQHISEYSHGMRRKIQIVAATMHHPQVLILDEPFRGLDPDAAAVLRGLLVSFTHGGGSVLIATHDMLRAQRDCDEVTIMSAGITVASGSPTLLVSAHPESETLEDVFLGVTGLLRDSAARSQSIENLFERPNHV